MMCKRDVHGKEKQSVVFVSSAEPKRDWSMFTKLGEHINTWFLSIVWALTPLHSKWHITVKMLIFCCDISACDPDRRKTWINTLSLFVHTTSRYWCFDIYYVTEDEPLKCPCYTLVLHPAVFPCILSHQGGTGVLTLPHIVPLHTNKPL